MLSRLLTEIVLAQDDLIEQPKPDMPDGLKQLTKTLLGWLSGAVLVASIGGILICAGMIVIGRRNRNQMATDGIVGVVWVLGGLALAASASGLVSVFMKGS